MTVHCSPIDKCASRKSRGRLSKEPVVLQIITDETVLSIEMVVQMIGNAIGGGCQIGRLRSRNTGSSFDAEGLELSRGENTRLLTDRAKNSAATAPVLMVRAAAAGSRKGSVDTNWGIIFRPRCSTCSAATRSVLDIDKFRCHY